MAKAVVIVQHQVPKVAQMSDKLCWKYCGEVLYRFKHGAGKKSEFERKLGKYQGIQTVLTPGEVDDCYKLLGFSKGDVKDITDLLLRKQPLIVGYDRGSGNGHLVVMIGYYSDGTLILNDGSLIKQKDQYKSGNERVTAQQLNKGLQSTFWY